MLRKLRKRLAAGRKNRPFHLLQVEPTFQCGLQCVMCPWRAMRAQGGSMTWETFTRVAAYFPLAEEVDLTGGGEPTMHPHLAEMVQAAKAAGCRVGFSTNGVRMTADLVQALVDHGLDWVSFSIDAARPGTYERIRQGAQFEQVLANVAYLRDLKAARGGNGPQMMAVFVMMGGSGDQNSADREIDSPAANSTTGQVENYHELPEFIALAHELGIEQVIAKNLDVILHADDDRRRLFSHDLTSHDGTSHNSVSEDGSLQGLREARRRADEQAKALGIRLRLYDLQPREQAICEQNPLRNLFVNWQGRVSPCITLSYAEERVFDGETVRVPCQVYGDVNRQDLAEIWEQPEYAAFRAIYADRLRWEQQSVFEMFLDANAGSEGSGAADGRPPAPPGCRTCYYLYGI